MEFFFCAPSDSKCSKFAVNERETEFRDSRTDFTSLAVWAVRFGAETVSLRLMLKQLHYIYFTART